jgi:uncharacterized protein Yka (UPF0111/DUF47 family)
MHMADPVSPAAAAPPRAAPAPRDREFDLLEEMAHTILEAAEALVGTLEGRIPVDRAWQTVRDLEHKGDAIARDLFETLSPSAPLGTERETLQRLTGFLDDVLDAIEAAAARLAIHRIRRALPLAREMGQIMLQSAHEIRQAIHEARRGREVFSHTRALHRLENQGDDVLRDALEDLFFSRRSARDIIKWKDICEMLEAGTDRCEDIANVIEVLVVQTGGEHRLAAGHVVVDADRHEASVAGAPVSLTTKEFSLLHLLVRHQGKVVRRERLLHEVWGEDYFGDSRTLDTHIGWLRKKVEPLGGVRFVAVRGIGYRLDLA